jgi:hypothetical protein
MSFNRLIYLIVLFIVGFVWFNIVSLLRLPHLRVFVYAVEPKSIIIGIWQKIRGYLLIVFGIVFMFLVMMYIIWLIIKKFVPNFPIPFRTILLKIPPFPQLERAGIFAFIGNLGKAAFGRGKFVQRLELLGRTFGMFIARNTQMIMDALGIGYLTKLPAGAKGRYADGNPNTGPSREDQLARNRKRARDNPFEPSDARKSDDEYQQCIEENTAPVTEEMSRTEKLVTNQKNSLARIICKTRSLQTWSRTLSGKM